MAETAAATLAHLADLADLEGTFGDDPDLTAGDLAGLTELVEIGPDRLDGVSDPANGMPALLLKQTGRKPRRVSARLLKTTDEKRFGLYVAYPAGRADRAVAADGHRDFAGAAAVEAGAWTFLDKGAAVGLGHLPATEGAGRVVESWIHRAPPWTLTAADGSTQTVHPGDWLVGIIWTPEAWAMVKAGDLAGVSMQGSARRRRPSPEALAGLRKSKTKGALRMPEKARKAAREGVRLAMADAGMTARLKAADKRLRKLEKARGLRCEKCSRTVPPDSGFCGRCGARVAAAAKARAGTAADARILRSVIVKARAGDHAAIVTLMTAFGEGTAARLMRGKARLREVGGSVAKAAAAVGGGETARCRTCGGSGRLRHPATGKPSRTCPSCRGAGTWTPDGDQVDMTPADADHVVQYATAAKEGSRDAARHLTALVGRDVAAALLSGEPLTAAEFRRGYLTACRASQHAEPGQEPRIPDASYVVSPEDFRRGPLTSGQERLAPASRLAV